MSQKRSEMAQKVGIVLLIAAIALTAILIT